MDWDSSLELVRPELFECLQAPSAKAVGTRWIDRIPVFSVNFAASGTFGFFHLSFFRVRFFGYAKPSRRTPESLASPKAQARKASGKGAPKGTGIT